MDPGGPRAKNSPLLVHRPLSSGDDTKGESFDLVLNRAERREPPATDSTYTTTLEVVKVPFKDRLVWNFAQGLQRLSAEMKDPIFWQTIGQERCSMVPEISWS